MADFTPLGIVQVIKVVSLNGLGLFWSNTIVVAFCNGVSSFERTLKSKKQAKKGAYYFALQGVSQGVCYTMPVTPFFKKVG